MSNQSNTLSLSNFENIIHNSIIEEISSITAEFNSSNSKLSYQEKLKKLENKNIPHLVKWEGIKNKILAELNPNNFSNLFYKTHISRVSSNFYQLEISLPYYQLTFEKIPHYLFLAWAEQNNINLIEDSSMVHVSSNSNIHNISFYSIIENSAFIYIATQDDFNIIRESFDFFKDSFNNSTKDIQNLTNDIFKTYEEDNYLKVTELFNTLISI